MVSSKQLTKFLNLLLTAGALFLCSFVAKGENLSIRRDVNLEWEKVEAATQYEIKITHIPRPGSKGPPRIFKSESASWIGPLKPGHYTMELRSYDDRNVPGEWSEASEFWVKAPPPTLVSPENEKKIISSEDKKEDISFTWKAHPGESEYQITVNSVDGTINKIEKTKKDTIVIELPVAQTYKWSVQTLMVDGSPGESPDNVNLFYLVGKKLPTPDIEAPLSKYVEELKWESSEFAKSYDLIVLRETNRGWKAIQKQKGHKSNQVAFDLNQPSGKYKLKVQAKSPMRESSKIAEREFEVRGGIRNPAALEEAKLRDSLEKPTHYYVIASYLITQINYQGEDRELNSGASFNALGGTGRLGAGYQHPENLWGIFGVIDLSGFDLDKERYTFAAAEIHGTWKQYWGKNQILYGGGLFMKELPDVRGSQGNGFSGLGKTQGLGPHGGIQIWRPLSARLGLQAQGRVYLAITGSGADGQAVKSGMSFQTGVLGTYKISPQIMGYAGYVYRADNMIYEARPFSSDNPDSFASPGDVNSISIGGSYLNLKLEYSF